MFAEVNVESTNVWVRDSQWSGSVRHIGDHFKPHVDGLKASEKARLKFLLDLTRQVVSSVELGDFLRAAVMSERPRSRLDSTRSLTCSPEIDYTLRRS